MILVWYAVVILPSCLRFFVLCLFSASPPPSTKSILILPSPSIHHISNFSRISNVFPYVSALVIHIASQPPSPAPAGQTIPRSHNPAIPSVQSFLFHHGHTRATSQCVRVGGNLTLQQTRHGRLTHLMSSMAPAALAHPCFLMRHLAACCILVLLQLLELCFLDSYPSLSTPSIQTSIMRKYGKVQHLENTSPMNWQSTVKHSTVSTVQYNKVLDCTSSPSHNPSSPPLSHPS